MSYVHGMQVHELTKRREYTGAVMDLAKGVSECPSGGQIVCCQATFASILDQQARILQSVPPHADHDVLYEMLRYSWHAHEPTAPMPFASIHVTWSCMCVHLHQHCKALCNRLLQPAAEMLLIHMLAWHSSHSYAQ